MTQHVHVCEGIHRKRICCFLVREYVCAYMRACIHLPNKKTGCLSLSASCVLVLIFECMFVLVCVRLCVMFGTDRQWQPRD